MSVCRIIASDIPLIEFKPSQDYPLEINIDKEQIFNYEEYSIIFKKLLTDFFNNKR